MGDGRRRYRGSICIELQAFRMFRLVARDGDRRAYACVPIDRCNKSIQHHVFSVLLVVEHHRITWTRVVLTPPNVVGVCDKAYLGTPASLRIPSSHGMINESRVLKCVLIPR